MVDDMSGFINWLFNPGTKEENFSLNQEISGVLLDESVTALQSQQERTERVFTLVSQSLGQESLVEDRFVWHNLIFGISYIYRQFKICVLRSHIENRIDIEKSQQIQKLFETRRNADIWFCSKASLQSRVSILKAASPGNKLFTDDELRLFAFDQAIELACSSSLSTNRRSSFVPFLFDKGGYAQHDVHTRYRFSFHEAMSHLKKEAQVWEAQRFRSWNVPLELSEADSLINLQIDVVREDYGLRKIPREMLVNFVIGLEKSADNSLEKLVELCKAHGVEKSVYHLKFTLAALKSSRSMDLLKLRSLSQAEDVSPELLERFEAAIKKGGIQGLSAFKDDERVLLRSTQAIYFAVKARPDILQALSSTDRRLFSRLYFAWFAVHNQVDVGKELQEVAEDFTEKCEENEIGEVPTKVLMEYLEILQRDPLADLEAFFEEETLEKIEDFYSGLSSSYQLDLRIRFLEENHPLHALILTAFLERDRQLTEARLQAEAEEIQDSLRELRESVQQLDQESLQRVISLFGQVPEDSTIEALVGADDRATLEQLKQIYETIRDTRDLHPFLNQPENENLLETFNTYNTYIIQQALSKVDLTIPEEVPNYEARLEPVEPVTIQADDGTEVSMPKRFVQNTAVLEDTEIAPETRLTPDCQFLFVKDDGVQIEVSTLKDIANMLAAVEKFDFVKTLPEAKKEAFLLQLLLSFDPRHSPAITQFPIELSKAGFQLTSQGKTIARFSQQDQAVRLEVDFQNREVGFLSGHDLLGAAVSADQVIRHDILVF